MLIAVFSHNCGVDEGGFARLSRDFAREKVGCVFAKKEEDLGEAFAKVECR